MGLINIQLRHLRAFLCVASEKSFARASEKLAISQPALSQTIIQLEAMLGFAVFVRTTRSVNLTKHGELFLEKAIRLNRNVETFLSEIKSLQILANNKLRVGYLIGTAVEFIPEITRRFEEARPQAALEFIEFDFNNPDAGLSTGLVDCGIFRPPIDAGDVQLVELAREQCVVCLPVGHMLAGQETVRVAQILDEPFIAAPGEGVWRDYWLAEQYRTAGPAKVVFEAATVDSELQAVATRKGISITAESTAKFYSRPGVIFRPIEDMEQCVIAIGFRQSSNPLVADFIAIAREVARQHEGFHPPRP